MKFYIKSVQEGREKLIIKMKVNESGLVWLILMSGCHPGNVHLVVGDYPVLGREGREPTKRLGEMVTMGGLLPEN